MKATLTIILKSVQELHNFPITLHKEGKYYISDEIEIEEQQVKEYILPYIEQYKDQWLISQLDYDEFYSYCIIHKPNEEYRELSFYNDYDDYEDGIELESKRWLKSLHFSEEDIKEYEED